jgi:zinc protease
MSLAIVAPAAKAANIQAIASPKGVKAWLVEDYTIPVVTVNFAFRGGAAQDPEGKSGLAHLVSGLLDEGAGDLDSRAFQARLEDLSIDLSFDAGPDAIYGNMRTLQQNTDQAFELLKMAVGEPRFDPEPVERVRGQVLANLRQSQTNPNDMVMRLWAETLFGKHPYSRRPDGQAGEVAALTADDIREFHVGAFARDNLYVVIVGAIGREAASAALDETFGDLPAHADLAPVPEVVPAVGEIRHQALSVPQTAIRIGGVGLKRNDPDFIAAYVADHILGGGTFSSRLYTAVREERGLAYSVGSALLPYEHSGATIAATSVDAVNADSAVKLMLDEIKRFAAEGPTQAELDAAKDYLVGNFALRFDSSQKIARNLLQFQLDDLGVNYINQRNDLIRAITLDDVKRVARRLYAGPLAVVTVGPAQS